MGPTSKREYTASIKDRYLKANKSDKQKILDEFCKVCNYNRKYAIRLLNSVPELTGPSTKKRGRKAWYSDPDILKIILRIWKVTNLPCSKRLKAILPLWLPHYPYRISEKVYDDLLHISPASIDRLIKPLRNQYNKYGLSTTC